MSSLRHALVAVRALLVLTVVLGIAYPLLVWGIGQVAFADRANGSLITRDGQVVASSLIGQELTGAQWFHGRPSASDYDINASGGSNLGPNSEELTALIDERRKTIAAEESVDPADVPPDAVTASASGLDPHISRAYADLQVSRVARENGLSASQVQALVEEHTEGGTISPARVNVVELNLDLAALAAS